MRRYLWIALWVAGTVALAQTPSAPQPPPDPTLALRQQVNTLTGQRDRCYTELGEQHMVIADIQANAKAGLIGGTAEIQQNLIALIEKANPDLTLDTKTWKVSKKDGKGGL